MAAGITSKSGAEARRAELERECAALEAQLAERDARFARLADELAGLVDLEAARAGAVVPTSTGVNIDTGLPAVKAAMPPPPPVDPAVTAWAREDTDLSALAIYSREPGAPEKGSRGFWRGQIDRLGAHLLPDGGPDDRLRAALRDPRGHALVEALQSCLN